MQRIFDLDGTLVDAYKAIQKSLNYTLKKLGYSSVPYQEVKRKVGKGDEIFIKTFFPLKDFKKALKIYQTHHKKSVLRYVKLLPYTKRLLYLLKRKKKIVAIASNRPKSFTNLILKKLDIKKYIDLLVCADEINSLKPNPKILKIILKKFKAKNKETIYIGDMDIDLEAAKRANLEAIYVKGGSTSQDRVKRYKNKKIASSLKEIIKYV
ncbi:MAG TPA: HAD family hydrolase [Candidatus Omnitrophica bacterium]|nr:HAD family hydrolase [Candidatus Omnitrophota bacterium]